MNPIYQKSDRTQEKFLRKKTEPFLFKNFSKKEVNELVQRMKQTMKEANGIGLSANQIGLPYRVFVAQVSGEHGGQKFYAIFNPTIEKTSGEDVSFEEGCLSIPGIFGDVVRPERVLLSGYDKQGRPLKIKAWGLLARVFQHEMDHLSGTLFIDKAKHLHRPESHGR